MNRIAKEYSLVALITLAIVEAALRYYGYPSNAQKPVSLEGAFVSDATLGWRHNPGSRSYASPEHPGATFTVTFTNSAERLRLRKTRPKSDSLAAHSSRDSDLMTEIHPDGSYKRSYPSTTSTTMERVDMAPTNPSCECGNSPPEILGRKDSAVVYGFADFHTTRNIKTPLGQRTWDSQGTFPFCDADGCSSWSGKDMSSPWLHAPRLTRLFSIAENALDTIRAHEALKHSDEVTQAILLAMQKEMIAHSTRLVIAPVVTLPQSWLTFFKEHQFEVASCVSPAMNQSELHLSDGHPNARWTDLYTDCLARHIAHE
jgi:hypothetical protein